MKRPARMGQVSLEMVSSAKLLLPLKVRLSINGFLKMHIFEEVVAIKKRNQNGHCVNCLLSYLNRLYCE